MFRRNFVNNVSNNTYTKLDTKLQIWDNDTSGYEIVSNYANNLLERNLVFGNICR